MAFMGLSSGLKVHQVYSKARRGAQKRELHRYDVSGFISIYMGEYGGITLLRSCGQASLGIIKIRN